MPSELDTFVRSEIAARGGRVVKTFLSSHELDLLIDGKRWSLDAFVHGSHPKRGSLPIGVCRDIGETLAILHCLPTKKFGKPSMLEEVTLIGQKTTPTQGVRQRFENPVTETWEEGFIHPILSLAPDIASETLARLREVLKLLAMGTACFAIPIFTESN